MEVLSKLAICWSPAFILLKPGIAGRGGTQLNLIYQMSWNSLARDVPCACGPPSLQYLLNLSLAQLGEFQSDAVSTPKKQTFPSKITWLKSSRQDLPGPSKHHCRRPCQPRCKTVPSDLSSTLCLRCTSMVWIYDGPFCISFIGRYHGRSIQL